MSKKKIIFPCTNRVHLARQKLLLKELRKYFEVLAVEYEPQGKDMAEKALDVFSFFLPRLQKRKPDLLLARADRFEILPITMLAAYMNIPVAHLEGGDLSSVIDGKVRHAITHLSDYHFPTNQDAHERLILMGVPKNRIWNYGSLDAEFALRVKKEVTGEWPDILVAYHPIPGENPNELKKALKSFSSKNIVKIASNNDYGKKYGNKSYTPEEYINAMYFSYVCVGNSSSFFKEASVLGVPVVNVGDRQKGRLRTKNIMDVPCESKNIIQAIQSQIEKCYELAGSLQDMTYYQPDTSKKISQKLKQILS